MPFHNYMVHSLYIAIIFHAKHSGAVQYDKNECQPPSYIAFIYRSAKRDFLFILVVVS